MVALLQWQAQPNGARTAFIEPRSPWENGYCESFNPKLRDQLLACEIFNSLAEARSSPSAQVMGGWRSCTKTEPGPPHSGRPANLAMTMAMRRLDRDLEPDQRCPLPPREITETVMGLATDARH